MRIEKPSFWFYRSQEETKPYLKIAATWQPGSPTRTVVVFTNCDQASLSINGKHIQSAKAERGPSTTYAAAKPFDGSNTANLPHPPIVFRNVPYASGKLEVSGFFGAAKVTDAIETAGKPVRLKVWVDDLGVPPGRNDLVFIRASVVDANGTICPTESRRIRFSVAGGEITGESSAPCEIGIASILVRTPMEAGRIKMSAAGGSLSGECKFDVKQSVDRRSLTPRGVRR